jgi:hypothetical protein
MNIIFFVGGVILGVIFTLIYKSRERIHGVVHVDHKTEQCVFKIESDRLSKLNKKIAVFYINHDAEISRDEQGL